MMPLRVLMLLGDPDRRHQLEGLLRQADYRVDTVTDAASAAESLRDTAIDTLVLDLRATGLDVPALRQALSTTDSLPPDSLEMAERRHLAQALRFTDGNKRQAALLLGISRSTLLNKVRKYALLVAAGLALWPLAGLPAQTTVRIPNGRVTSGTLSFDGHATVGDFVGRTTTVTGELTGGDNLSAVRGWVQAPVKTLTTENARRDKDLNKSMESDKHPDIRFELSGVTTRGGSRDSIAVTLRGTLHLHGVGRAVAFPATVQLSDSEARIRSDFPLSLKHYRIGGLSKMLGVLKMYDNIEVHVDLRFELSPPPASP